MPTFRIDNRFIHFCVVLLHTGKKIYRIKIEVDCPPEKLIRALDSHDLTTWNKSLAKHEVIKEFPNGVKISYQVTPESGPGGVVSSRDFILAYKQVHKGNEWMEGGCSVDYPGPTSSKFVRAWNGPTGQYVRPLPNPQKVCRMQITIIRITRTWIYIIFYDKWIALCFVLTTLF